MRSMPFWLRDPGFPAPPSTLLPGEERAGYAALIPHTAFWMTGFAFESCSVFFLFQCGCSQHVTEAQTLAPSPPHVSLRCQRLTDLESIMCQALN